jgi:hypothetical protein
MSQEGTVLVRVLRWVAVVVAVTLAIVGACQEGAFAHSAAELSIHTDNKGSVWVTAKWQDGHPITEPMAAALIATSRSGQRIGPVGLKAMHDEAGTLTLEQRLGAGEWTVVADLATPAIGHCEAVVPVAAAGQPAAAPTETRCAAASQAADVNKIRRGIRPVTLAVIGAGLGIAFLLAVVVYVNRPPTPAPPPSRIRRRR